MKIGLIDVDGHNFPNLALMKISAYYKAKGDHVEWHLGDLFHYDKVFMSKVFSSSYSPYIEPPQNADQVIMGGTGYAIETENGKEIFRRERHWDLPHAVETTFPDYSIYPQFNFAISMTTRGCPRKCGFCHVSRKEGCESVKVSDVWDYWKDQKQIKVLDANILACRDRERLLWQYAKTGAEIDYCQGLDIRLIDQHVIDALNATKLKQVHFAWDNPKEDLTKAFMTYASLAKNKPKGRYGMVYVLVNFNSTLEEDLYRINTLRALNYDPYVMVYNKPAAPQQIKDLQRWCNNKIIFGAEKDFSKYVARG